MTAPSAGTVAADASRQHEQNRVDNHTFNGPLMIMPGSHRTYVSCVGETPDENYKSSLVQQVAGTPDQAALSALAEGHGIDVLEARAGGATMFDRNCMHGSNGNITPFPRSNVFIVHNSVENTCVEPLAAARPAGVRRCAGLHAGGQRRKSPPDS